MTKNEAIEMINDSLDDADREAIAAIEDDSLELPELSELFAAADAIAAKEIYQ